MSSENVSAQDPDRLLNIDEAAALLGAKKGTLYSWVSRGSIPFRKVGSLVRFHRGDLMRWTVEQGQGVASEQAKPRRSKLRMVK